ncbi:MAG: serine/threonine-protein phosphatase [Gemmatimonadaceae bacterium]|nr:serine/threonine-protein phosphatase [Gemmatimonadaceae bacterium]
MFNVGDSRAYHITVDGAEQVTEDHSFVAEAAKHGQADGVEAARSRWKNALTRSVGNEGPLEVDVFGPFTTEEPHVVVLCSDGVYKGTPDHVISSVVRAVPDVTTAAQTLIDVAFRRGSDDNMSAVLLEFGSLPRSTEITLPVPLMDGGEQIDEDLSTVPSMPSVDTKTLSTTTVTRDWPASATRKKPQSSRQLIAIAVCAVGLAAMAASWWFGRDTDYQPPNASAIVKKKGLDADTSRDTTKSMNGENQDTASRDTATPDTATSGSAATVPMAGNSLSPSRGSQTRMDTKAAVETPKPPAGKAPPLKK